MKNCRSGYIDALVMCVSYPWKCGNNGDAHGDKGKKASNRDRRMEVRMVDKNNDHAKHEPQKA